MAYKRSRKRMRRGGNRSITKYNNKYAWYNSANALPLAKQALDIAKWVASVINVEYKKNDITVYNNVATVGSATITLLTGLAQGDTSSTRNGNSIKGKSVSIKGNIQAGLQKVTHRYILFYDKNSNSTAPAVTDLLESDSVYARYNDDNSGSRFKIIKDLRFTTGFNDTVNHYTGGMQTKDWSMYCKVFSHQKFDGTTAAQGDAVSGHYYLLSTHTSTASSHTVNSRYLFIDN